MGVKIEFLPWYQPEGQLVRCSGCAALVVSGDAETHVKWHESQSPPEPMCECGHVKSGHSWNQYTASYSCERSPEACDCYDFTERGAGNAADLSGSSR